MERDPSGTDYGQYWQPEQQQPEGYPEPAQPQPKADTDGRTRLIRGGIGALALIVLAVAGYTVAGQGASKKPGSGTAAQTDLAGSHTRTWSVAAASASAGNDGLLGSW